MIELFFSLKFINFLQICNSGTIRPQVTTPLRCLLSTTRPPRTPLRATTLSPATTPRLHLSTIRRLPTPPRHPSEFGPLIFECKLIFISIFCCRYYSAPAYYTTAAPYTTTTYAAPSYYATEASYYVAPTYYATAAPSYYYVPIYYTTEAPK